MLKSSIFYSIFVMLFLSVSIFPQNQIASVDSNITKLGHLSTGFCYTTSLTNNSNTILIGSGRGVRIMDVTNKEHPIMLSEVHTKGAVADVFASGNYAYIATNGSNGTFVSDDFPGELIIVNISDLQIPTIISSLDLGEPLQLVRVNGNYAYVAGINKVWVIDVSKPSTPKKIKSIGFNSSPHGLFIDNNNLFVSAQSGGFNIYNLSTPANPSFVGKYDVWAEKAFIRDTLAFITGQNNKVEILSINNPAAPIKIGEASTDNSIEQFFGVSVAGHNLYVTGRRQQLLLKVFDISSPGNPSFVSEYYDTTANTSNVYGNDIVIDDHYAYVPSISGLRIFDINDAGNTVEKSRYETSILIKDVQIKGTLAYVAFSFVSSHGNGLSIIDISNPLCLHEISYLYSPLFVGSDIILTLSDNYAYYSHKTLGVGGGIHVINIKNTASPTQETFMEIKNLGSGLAVKDNFLFVETTNNDSMRTFDISNPETPKLIGSCGIPYEAGFPNKYLIDNNFLYVGTSLGLLIIDISSPASSAVRGFYKLENGFYNVNGLTKAGNTVYLAAAYGLVSVNVSDPNNPYGMAYKKLNAANDVEIINGNIFVASGGQGIRMFYEANDSTFSIDGYYNEKWGWANDLATDRNNIYVTYDGLMIFKKGFPSSVKTQNKEIPTGFALFQNYPNPFNPTTTINYSIPSVQTGHALSVQLIIYDILGKEVATLVNKKQAPGNYSVMFNAKNLPSGVYFYKISIGNFVDVKKMMLLK